MFQKPKIGVAIPSYNEGQDLIDTLECVFKQTSAFAEVIVVDDSSDGTDRLVRSTFEDNVKLIHRDRPQGRCSARNTAIQMCAADVVVILNADVSLPPHFCDRLQQKYQESDCDALGVESVITNTEHPYPRYLHALHLSFPKQKRTWTEGFSVRRSAFFKTQGFADGYPLPILAGEDVKFVFDLQDTGASLCFDYDLKVTTVMPEDWPTIESQIRGRASLRTWHFIYDKSLLELLLRSIVKQVRRLVIIATVMPLCWQVFWLWYRYNQGWQDLWHYAKYELLDKWLRSHQEWLDLISFIKLYAGRREKIIDIFFKPPSQLSVS